MLKKILLIAVTIMFFSEYFFTTHLHAETDNEHLYESKVGKALELYYDGDYESAIKLCDEAIELKPNNAWWAYQTRGLACYESANYNQAISDFTKANELGYL